MGMALCELTVVVEMGLNVRLADLLTALEEEMGLTVCLLPMALEEEI